MMSEAGVTRFYQGDHRRGRWYFHSRGNNPIYVETLVGKTVNIGTKDGMVFDSARVTAFDDRQGILTITGGLNQSYSGEPVPTGTERVWVHDIARGYIHGEPEPQGQLPDRVATLQVFLLRCTHHELP
jgi:hypothetical protein